MWRPNLRGRADEYVVRAIDKLYEVTSALSAHVETLRRQGGNTPVDTQAIKQSLQAGGSTPLNVEGLIGHLSQPQTGGAPALATFPAATDPLTQEGALFVVSGSPNNLYRVNRSVEPPTFDPIGGSGSVSSIATGTGLTGGPITGTGTISLANTTVTAGSYTFSGFTVDAQGRLTAASSGSTAGFALTANPLSQFASTTSAQLAGVLSDKTGTGSAVFSTSPSLTTPSLGVATATTINGVTLDNNAWTAYTPTITVGSGSLTSATAFGRYKILGKTVFFWVAVAITTNGTAADSISLTLPTTTAAITQTAAGMESALTGKTIRGYIAPSGTTVQMRFYDNTYPGANGNACVMEGVYESA